DVDLARKDLRTSRHQQHVVEGEGSAESLLHLLRRGEGRQRFHGHRPAPWHFLYFLPLPQGQRSFRPTFGSSRRTVRTPASSPPTRAGAGAVAAAAPALPPPLPKMPPAPRPRAA